MTVKKRNNENHPWKKPFQWETAKAQKAIKKELDKVKDKYGLSNSKEENK